MIYLFQVVQNEKKLDRIRPFPLARLGLKVVTNSITKFICRKRNEKVIILLAGYGYEGSKYWIHRVVNKFTTFTVVMQDNL